METFVAPGNLQTFTAPGGGVVSGTGYQIGSQVVIATATVAAGSLFAGLVVGVCDLAKVPAEIWTENEKIYFDASAGLFTEDPDTATNPLVGVAVKPVVATFEITTDALAADLLVAGGTITVLDYAALADATVTVTIGGVATVLLEEDSGDWEAGTSNAATADSLAAAIEGVAGVNDATAVSNVITVTPGTGATAANPAVGRVRLDGAVR